MEIINNYMTKESVKSHIWLTFTLVVRSSVIMTHYFIHTTICKGVQILINVLAFLPFRTIIWYVVLMVFSQMPI